jgi:hypothetical protein
MLTEPKDEMGDLEVFSSRIRACIQSSLQRSRLTVALFALYYLNAFPRMVRLIEY